MTIWYITKDGEFKSTEDITLLKIEDFIQNLQIWRGEQSFNIANGVDWLSVLNENTDIKYEINNIAANYNDFFQVSDIIVSKDRNTKVLKVTLTLTLLNEDTKINKEVLIK